MPFVRLLGPVDVIDDNGVAHTPRSPLRRTLLALLALQPRTLIDAEGLLDAAWNGQPPQSGLRALRFHVSRMRAEIGIDHLIVTVGRSYRLDADTDIALVQQGLSDHGDLAPLIVRWRGPPLADCAHTITIEHEQRRLTELRLTVAERHYQQRLAAGDTTITGDLTRLCLDHPLRESLWAVLITAHYRAGHQAQALRAYDQVRRNLHDQLGVTLTPELQQLEHDILDHELPSPAPSAPSALRTAAPGAGLGVESERLGDAQFGQLCEVGRDRHTLPTRRTRLIGRDREVAELMGLIGEGRLVTLVGPGGIGKTSVAVETAGKMTEAFRGGAHFVDLATISHGDDVVGAVCRGVQLAVLTAPYDELVAFLRDDATLLVVDNCEHVIDDAADVIDRLVSDVTKLHVLATSREHLDLDGERVFTLGPLSVERSSSAVQLFVERFVAVYPNFHPDEDDLERIVAICARLDGLPLAIELAAGRGRTMSLADIEQRLDDRFSLLAGGRRGKLRRHKTLRATLDWSTELLDLDEAELLSRLAVYVSGFDHDGAEAVMPAAAQRAADLVRSLAAKSLVQRLTDVGGRARYRLLETVREWGLEDLDRRGLLREARDLHARRFRDAHVDLDLYEVTTPGTAIRWEHDLAELTAAIRHLLDHGDPVGAALVVGPHKMRLGENHAALALEATAAGRAQATPELASLLWFNDRLMKMMTGVSGKPHDDSPPLDDGSRDWRFLVGGPDHDYGGLAGWDLTWAWPAKVAAGVAALPPAGPDPDSLMVRSFALGNACIANFHLGRHREALDSWEESQRMRERAGWPRASGFTDSWSALSAAVAVGHDLRHTAFAQALRGLPSSPLKALARALADSEPPHRRVELAIAARTHSLGRWPAEESSFLTQFASLAIDDGDLERGDHLNCTATMRNPATLAQKRHNMIKARQLPAELISDEAHHRDFLIAERRVIWDPDLRSLNRKKMLDEVARLLD